MFFTIFAYKKSAFFKASFGRISGRLKRLKFLSRDKMPQSDAVSAYDVSCCDIWNKLLRIVDKPIIKGIMMFALIPPMRGRNSSYWVNTHKNNL